MATESEGDATDQAQDVLRARFDGLLENMQKPEARKGIDAAFHANPEDFGRTISEAARRAEEETAEPTA